MVRFALVKRAILTERSHAERLAITVLAVFVPTVLRLALDGGANGVPFVTYFPAILVAALLVAWEYATACAILSALTANWLFINRAQPWVADRASLVIVALFMLSCALLIASAQALRSTVRELDAATTRESHFNTELQHRVKNILAVVQALASQSAKEKDPAEFARAFGGRLAALAKAHDVLSAGALESCALPELVTQACLPFRDARNIRVAGPHCRLPAASCVPLALAVHELCTNAIKHGALSGTEPGHVEVSWAVSDDSRCVFEWCESNGPRVDPPERSGLGRRLLTRQPGLAQVDLLFDPAGLRCTIVVDGATPAPEP